MGTRGGGIRMYDRTKNILYPKLLASDVFNDDIFEIKEDDTGFLWVSSNNGLTKIAVSTKGNSAIIKSFDVDDGLQANQFNLWASFKSKDGSLFFGGINGVNYFKPNEIVFNERKPDVVFTGFSLFNKDMVPGGIGSPLTHHISECKEIVLNYQQSVFSIEFCCNEFYPTQKQPI